MHGDAMEEFIPWRWDMAPIHLMLNVKLAFVVYGDQQATLPRTIPS